MTTVASLSSRRGFTGMLVWSIGWLSLILGCIGVILPIMPTAPFLVVAAACFARTDPAMRDRMFRIPVAGRYLSDLANGRALSPLMQILSLLFVWATIAYALAVAVKAAWLKIALVFLAVLTSLHVLFMGRKRS